MDETAVVDDVAVEVTMVVAVTVSLFWWWLRKWIRLW